MQTIFARYFFSFSLSWTIYFSAVLSFADSLPSPEEVQIGNLTRSADFVSELGDIEMRWPREIERCFGQVPNRAMADALTLARRVLLRFPFPKEVKNSQASWNIVFTDEKSAESQFPGNVIMGRHPGFMLPPNKIYIIADFISPDCDLKKAEVDLLLRRVLVHEIGHVIEFTMLGEEFGKERARAEGFASWFELEALRGMSKKAGEEIEQDFLKQARAEYSKKGFDPRKFSGTSGGYALWAMYFQALVERKGFGALARGYKTAKETGKPLFEVIERESGFGVEDAGKALRAG